jgi:hypothetical protein
MSIAENLIKEMFDNIAKKLKDSPELPKPKLLCNKVMLEGFREKGLTEEQLKELIVNYEDLVSE